MKNIESNYPEIEINEVSRILLLVLSATSF